MHRTDAFVCFLQTVTSRGSKITQIVTFNSLRFAPSTSTTPSVTSAMQRRYTAIRGQAAGRAGVKYLTFVEQVVKRDFL